MNEADIAHIKGLVGEANVTEPPQTRKYVRDYHWFSPRLAQSMRGLAADLVVHARDADSLQALVAYCVERGIAITPRGAGTGNYGQAMPLKGGIILDFQTLDEVLEIDAGSGRARCSAGLTCRAIEEAAREAGWEMLMYPSTWATATLGGFLAGGSAGIGSIRHGVISDGEMVRGLRILTAESTPRILTLAGEACANYLHAYGINGLILEADIKLAPKLAWDQALFSASDLATVFGFAVELGGQDRFDLRLLNVQQWPIPSFFKPIRDQLVAGEHIVQIEVASSQLTALRAMAEAHGLTERIHYPHHEPRRAPMLSDFVQNHSTLWAKKHDRRYTYMTVKLDPTDWRRDLAALAAAPGYPMYLRCDFSRAQGALTAAAGPIFYAESVDEIDAKARYLKERGLFFYDVHASYIDRDGMAAKNAAKVGLKPAVDPQRILNPGRIQGEQAN